MKTKNKPCVIITSIMVNFSKFYVVTYKWKSKNYTLLEEINNNIVSYGKYELNATCSVVKAVRIAKKILASLQKKYPIWKNMGKVIFSDEPMSRFSFINNNFGAYIYVNKTCLPTSVDHQEKYNYQLKMEIRKRVIEQPPSIQKIENRNSLKRLLTGLKKYPLDKIFINKYTKGIFGIAYLLMITYVIFMVFVKGARLRWN